MYNLTIHFGPNAVAWSFLFKNEEKAGEAYNAWVNHKVSNAEGGILIGSDDYGQSFAIPMDGIHGILLEDTELGTEARILRGLDQMRGQARATKRAMTDPEIQQLQRGQGPSVLTPFNGGLHRQ